MSRESKLRMRIGPGGSIYAVVVLFILVLAVITQANLLFWSFGLLVGGVVVSCVMSCFALCGVEARRLIPAHGTVVETLNLRYCLANKSSWLPVFNIVIRETWDRKPKHWEKIGISEKPPRLTAPPHGWVMHVGPKQTVQVEAPCWPLRRGILRFERIEISTAFPFGTIRRVKTIQQAGEVLVYPRLYRINRKLMHKMNQLDVAGSVRRPSTGDMGEFFGLRDYRAGDSLKLIDWKHSARTGQLICREMTRPIPPQVLLGLDLGNARDAESDNGLPPQEVLVEQAISLAASVVCEAHLQGYQIGMIIHGAWAPSLAIHHSHSHRARMLEILARLDATRSGKTWDAMSIEPSVLIRLGHGTSTGRTGGCLVLGAADLDQYVQEGDGGAARLLAASIAERPRRNMLQDNRL